MDIQNQQATTGERLSLPTPTYFKTVRLICQIIGGVITAGAVIWTSIVPSNVMNIIVAIGGTFTLVATVISSLPVDWNQAQQGSNINIPSNTERQDVSPKP